MKLPVWAPPLRIAERTAARSSRRRRSRSSVERSDVLRSGEIRACQRIWSASRLPIPEIARWLSSRALIAVRPAPIRRRNSSRPTSAASGPDVREVRVEHGAAEPALVAQDEPAAVLELEREAIPAGGVLGVDEDPAGHPEVQPERRAVLGLEPHELAAAVGGGERVAGQRAGDLAGRVRPAHVRVGSSTAAIRRPSADSSVWRARSASGSSGISPQRRPATRSPATPSTAPSDADRTDAE